MINFKNFDNFWYYHKFKLLGAVIAVAVIIIIVGTGGKGIKPDVEVAYVTDGRTISSETEGYLKDRFASRISDLDGDNNKSTAFIALQGPRIDMEFVADGAQIVLMDGSTLRKFIGHGVFEPLDSYAGKLNIDLSKYPMVRTKTDETDEIHTYAIPMKYLPLLLEVGFPSEDYYLTVRTVDHENKTALAKMKNAFCIMDALLEQRAQ